MPLPKQGAGDIHVDNLFNARSSNITLSICDLYTNHQWDIARSFFVLSLRHLPRASVTPVAGGSSKGRGGAGAGSLECGWPEGGSDPHDGWGVLLGSGDPTLWEQLVGEWR